MRRTIGTVGATLAIAVTMAISAAPAGAYTAIEYAVMSGFAASDSDEAERPYPASELGGIEFWQDDSRKDVVESGSAAWADKANSGAPEFGFDVTAQRTFQYDVLGRLTR
jgi:hypothetical protein